jgi:hypothetical protein
MSESEWAQLLATLFAAVAAGAAWASVIQTSRRHKEAIVPSISAAFESIGGEGIVPEQRIAFVNGGRGLAVGSILFGVEAEETFGGPVASHVAPGEKATALVSYGRRLVARNSSNFVWLARDIENGLHAWSHHGAYVKMSPQPRDVALGTGNVPSVLC